jgi:hypothetical protein
MRTLIGLLCVILACAPALAQDKSKDTDKKVPPVPPKMTSEQKKQAIARECRKEAAALKLKDEDRKSFLSSCLMDSVDPKEIAP